MKILEITNLTKIYKTRKQKEIKALYNFNLELNSGEVFGLIGPNGAGKTTLIKSILGMVKPDSGEIKIFGEDAKNNSIKKRIGYLPENHKFLPYLTATETLKIFSELSGKSKINSKEIEDSLKLVGLEKVKKKKVKTFSKGMMQRLGIAQALIHNPELIMLDEPTDGVDPIGRKEIRNIIANLKKQGKTVLINSHLLSEVEMICDEIAILNNGELVKKGNIKEFLSDSKSFRIEVENTNEILDLVNEKIIIQENRIIWTGENTAELNLFIDILRERKILIKSIVKSTSNLEDYFIEIIDGGRNVK